VGGGNGADGRPLPPVGAAIALSGFGELPWTPVPLQLQSADYDAPGATADDSGSNVTDGPMGTADYYRRLDSASSGRAALQLILEAGGSHFDTTNVPGIPHSPWAHALTTTYASAWFGCNLQHARQACRTAQSPQPGLSQAYASQYDMDGPGPLPSRCLGPSDAVHPYQAESVFGGREQDCTP
jgi:hypothetical protein